MPAERFFAPLPHTSLTGEECRHLIRVMRARVGDTIELIDGKGTLTTAEITAIDKERCLLRPLKQHHFPPTLPPLILAQALPRQNRLDTIVEKGTELGMSTLWLFPGDRSEKKGVSLERLTAITIAATKQCGRLHLPTIVLMPPLTEWENLPTPTYYGTLAPNAPSLISLPRPKLLLIGPEKGLSEKEFAHLNTLNAQGVTLHPNTLRTDTAAIAALAQISLL